MQLSKGDFIIARVNEKKRALLISKSNASTENDYPIQAVLADELSGTKAAEKFTIDRENLLCNLGSDIEEGGSAFGIKIEPWREEFAVKYWGPIQSFRSLSPKEKSMLTKHLIKCGIRLKKRRLNNFLPLASFHIYPKRGRYAGYYKYSTKDGDQIGLHPGDLTENVPYIIYHESGHGIWFRCMSKKLKARWIRLYHKCVRLTAANPKEVTRLSKEYVKSGLPVKDFRSQLGEDSKELFAEILGWVAVNHHLEPKHLDALMESGSTDDMINLFPDRELLLSKVDALITDYGATKPEEFFAEAFAYTMTKQELPVGVKKLMRITFKRIGAK